MAGQLKDVLQNRYLLWSFIRADLRNRYGASFLGFFWSVINPLLLILLYTLVFGYILDINVGGNAGPKNYGLFLFSGMLPWLAVSDATQRASNVILENRDLVKQVRFPKIMLPLRCVISAFIHELVALVVFLVILVVLNLPPMPVMLGMLIAIWPLQLLFTTGLCLFVASVTVFYKDARELTTALLTLWFFATPVIFPVDVIPKEIGLFFFFNPLTPLMNLHRAALLGNEVPDLYGFAYFALFSIMLFIFGWVWFKKMARDFADLI